MTSLIPSLMKDKLRNSKAMEAKIIASAMLHDLFTLVMTTSRLTGATMFILDSDTHLHFSCLDIAFFLLMVRTATSLFLIKYQPRAKMVMGWLVGYRSEIVDFVTDVLACMILIESVVGDLLIFFRRRKLISFQQNLKRILLEIVDEPDSLREFQDLMKQARTRISIMVKLTLGLLFYYLIILPFLLRLVLLGKPQRLDIVDAMSLFCLICLWSAASVILNFRRIWFISALHCVKIGVVLVSCQRDILSRCQKLENLVKNFNEAFGPFMAAEMLVLLTAQFMIFFLQGMFVILGNFDLLASLILGFIVNFCIIFAICQEAEEFCQEVRKFALSLKRLKGETLIKREGDPFKISMLHAKWISKTVSIDLSSYFTLSRATCTSVR